MALQLFANRSSDGDFIFNAFSNFTSKPCNIYIAVAFFTQSHILLGLKDRGCPIRIVVRLGYPTSPKAIKEILEVENIQVRYVTDKSFHSKLYIFGDSIALVGSANLTDSAIKTNQEIMVTIASDDPRFEELQKLFFEYWDQAKVLTKGVLYSYEQIYKRYLSIGRKTEDFNNDILSQVGRVTIDNINRGHKKGSKENIFIDDFRRTYQQFIEAYNVIEKEYESIGKRKYPEKVIPIRLEIDSFISFVRERHAQKSKWQEAPIITGEEQRSLIHKLIQEWHGTSWKYFDNTIVKKNYPRLKRIFSSAESIRKADDETIIEGLSVLHSFHDRLRFFTGGFQTLAATFLKKNKPEKIKKSLIYLLFGKDDVEIRMVNMIYNPKYSLSEFGKANVQELVGWSNDEGLPVINGRTTKVMRFLGFDVKQL
ncbi:MAG: phospholipase D-like domain-containing protein [Thermodesulfobacteriota bacterium]|nr:phospholipase D-like domain-containing protein [Thermodesulfobacteriota bacterium]